VEGKMVPGPKTTRLISEPRLIAMRDFVRDRVLAIREIAQLMIQTVSARGPKLPTIGGSSHEKTYSCINSVVSTPKKFEDKCVSKHGGIITIYIHRAK